MIIRQAKNEKLKRLDFETKLQQRMKNGSIDGRR